MNLKNVEKIDEKKIVIKDEHYIYNGPKNIRTDGKCHSAHIIVMVANINLKSIQIILVKRI